MEKKEKKKFVYSLFFPLTFVVLMWSVELIERSFDLKFTEFGIYPQTVKGLIGIITAPFIHADWKHLINNSIPLLILGSSLFYFYKDIAWKVLTGVYLMGGFWTWIAARESYHIGASGVVYGLFGFLLVSGFIRRHRRLMAISFLVAFIYGSMVWGIFPIDYRISWEGHLFGMMAGIALAVLYRKKGPQRPVYSWELDDEEEDGSESADSDQYWKVENKNKSSKKSGESNGIKYIYIPKKKEHTDNK